jgi:hypothetical protein
MLLNTDIQNKNCSNDFTFSKGKNCNYVHYLKKLKISNSFIWTKFH